MKKLVICILFALMGHAYAADEAPVDSVVPQVNEQSVLTEPKKSGLDMVLNVTRFITCIVIEVPVRAVAEVLLFPIEAAGLVKVERTDAWCP